MSRHSKNNTASPVFSYYERQQLKDYGTQKKRLGKESLKALDICFLCLHPLVEPLSCLKGHLFCKHCIYESLIVQQTKIKEEKKRLKFLKERDELDRQMEEYKSEKERIESFEKLENGIKTVKEQVKPKEKINAYWMNTPNIDEEVLRRKRDIPKIQCPQGKHVLKAKHLIKVEFTVDDEKNNICPMCKKTLISVAQAVVLKRCGHVYCGKCVKGFLAKSHQCTECSLYADEDDFITIDGTFSAFASEDNKDRVVAKIEGPAPRFS